MKKHIMKLYPSPFRLIAEGKKTIELRLYDEKRKAISVGDTITFVNSEDSSAILNVIVIELFIFDSFDELYQKLPLLECGYTEENINMATASDMELYYSKEQQKKNGVVGIKVSLI